jgi:sugar O-acyltransferase (sialic acid O-acetyltransferase NeuD family)
VATRKLVIIGAGGFAREVKWLAADITAGGNSNVEYEFVGYVVSDTSEPSEHDSSDEILGDFGWLRDNPDSFDCLAMGIGNAAPRLKVATELEESYGPEFWPSMVHPSAHLDFGSAKIQHGVQICANVIGTVNLVFEPFAMVNLACTIGHEAVLRRACTLNPTVNISGGVDIGAGSLIGTGAQILQYLTIGSGATVGAGSVVTKNVPDKTLVVGIPAKPLPRKTQEK